MPVFTCGVLLRSVYKNKALNSYVLYEVVGFTGLIFALQNTTSSVNLASFFTIVWHSSLNKYANTGFFCRSYRKEHGKVLLPLFFLNQKRYLTS